MPSSSRAACDSSNEAAGVHAGSPGIHWWSLALGAVWQRLSRMDRYTWVDKCPASDWLRRDIGLTEDVMTRELHRIDEIRRKHSGWF